MNNVIITRINDLAIEHKVYAERFLEIDYMFNHGIGDYREYDRGLVDGYLRRIENELYFLFSLLTNEEKLQFTSLEENLVFNVEGSKFDINNLEVDVKDLI